MRAACNLPKHHPMPDQRLHESSIRSLSGFRAPGERPANRLADGPSNVRCTPWNCSIARTRTWCRSAAQVDPEILFPPEYPYTSGTTRILRGQLRGPVRTVQGPAMRRRLLFCDRRRPPTTVRSWRISRPGAAGFWASTPRTGPGLQTKEASTASRLFSPAKPRAGGRRPSTARPASSPQPTSSRTWWTSTRSWAAFWTSWTTTVSSSPNPTTCRTLSPRCNTIPSITSTSGTTPCTA